MIYFFLNGFSLLHVFTIYYLPARPFEILVCFFFRYWHTNLIYDWFVSVYFCLRLSDNFCLCQNTEPCWLRKSSESHSLGKESTVVHFHSILNDKNKTRDKKSDRKKTLGNTYLPPGFTILFELLDCQESQTVILLQLNHSAMLLFLQMYLSIIFGIRITLFYFAVLQHTCQSCSSTDGQQLSTELILLKTQMPSIPYSIRSVYVCNIFRAFSVIISLLMQNSRQHDGWKIWSPIYALHLRLSLSSYFWIKPVSEIPGGSKYSKSCGEDFAHVKAQLSATRVVS